MARILAFDFGKVRTGIAETDELQIIATGLTTVKTNELFSFLDTYLKKESVELFLVGEPKQMNNTASESEVLILPFLKKLGNKYPKIPIERIDDIVAVTPGLGVGEIHVLAGRLRESRHVQPVSPPAFSELRTRQELIHLFGNSRALIFVPRL